MAGRGDFWGDPPGRFGRTAPETEQSPTGESQTEGFMNRLQGLPLWKAAILGGVAFGAAGTALFALLLAAGALFVLLLLFGSLFGKSAAQAAPPPAEEPTPTYH